jgi:DNA-binding NarL/FixJ family response regulator
VLVVGVDWTQHTVAAALGAGVTGCLAKDPEFVGVAGSLQAVATGAMVMSPELLSLWLPRPRSSSEGRSLARLDKLTVRERQVLTLLSEGLSTDETARSCGVSPVTIKSHVSHALAKLGARNRLEAVLMVREALVANNGPGGARRGRHVAEV